MALSRFTPALLCTLTLTLTTSLLAGCQPLECEPTSVSDADGEAEAGYTRDSLAALIEGDHGVRARDTATGEVVEGSINLSLEDVTWQRWEPVDDSVESCPDTQALIEAKFDLVIGDVDISGTFAGEAINSDLVTFSIYVSESQLVGGVDVTDEGDIDGALLDITISGTDARVFVATYREASETYEPLLDRLD